MCSVTDPSNIPRTYNTIQIVEDETHISRFVDSDVTVIFNYDNIKDHIKLIVKDARETVHKPVGEVKIEYGCKEYEAISEENEKVLILYCEDDLETIDFYPEDINVTIRYINLNLPKEDE